MNKKNKIIIIIVAIAILLGIGLYFIIGSKPKEKNTIEVIDNVSNYNYELEDRDTEIYKENFLKLKEVLEKEEIDYNLYVSYVAKLFLIDVYTINNKISKYDIGGLEFIYPSDQEKFKNKLMDTMYKLVLDNSNNNRKQNLPEVSDVSLSEAVSSTYTINDKNLRSYEFIADISYKQNLGYDNKVKIVVVVENNYAYIVSLSSIE